MTWFVSHPNQTYFTHTRPSGGRRIARINGNDSQTNGNTAQTNNNASRNNGPAQSNNTTQTDNAAKPEEPSNPVEKADSKEPNPSKDPPLKSILKNKNSVKKVRFANPLTSVRTMPHRDDASPPSDVATDGSKNPPSRTRLGSPRPYTPREEANNLSDASSDISSNTDSPPRINPSPTPPRGILRVGPGNVSRAENREGNWNRGNAAGSGNLASRRGRQPNPVSVRLPLPRSHANPRRSPTLPAQSGGPIYISDSDSDASNIDDEGQELCSRGDLAHAGTARLQTPTLYMQLRYPRHPVEFVPVYRLGNRNSPGGPEIRDVSHIFCSNENLRTVYRNLASVSQAESNGSRGNSQGSYQGSNQGNSRRNNQGSSKDSIGGDVQLQLRPPTPPRRQATVEDASDSEVAW
jgi:hypothetical protein